MDPISVISGIMQIVSNVYSVSKELYELIDSIKHAPLHVLAMAQDIQGLYLVLGSLQGLLRDLQQDRLPPNILPIFESLQQPLNHCLFAFQQLQQKISKYTRQAGNGQIQMRKWNAFWWQFTEKDVSVWRAHLLSYKLTLNVAIATVNLANTSQNMYATQTLERQLHAMRIQIDEMRQDDLALSTQSSIEAENGSEITDRFFALNRFLETTETMFSMSPPSSPSISPDILSMKGKVSMLPQIQPHHRLSFDKLVNSKVLNSDSINIVDVALSLDGTRVASCSENKIRLWDTTTGSTYRTLEGHSQIILSIEFSPDGGLLTSGSTDKTVRLWDTTTGANTQILEGHSDTIQAVAFSPDSQLVASASADMTIRLWDITRGSSYRILKGHSDWVVAIAFSSDGAMLASGSDDKTVRLWDSTTGVNTQILGSHSDPVNTVVFSPDSKLVVSASMDGTIWIWVVGDSSKSSLIRGDSHSGKVVAFAPTGNLIAIVSDNDIVPIRVWDLITFPACWILEGLPVSAKVHSLEFSLHGRLMVASSGLTDGLNDIWLWEWTTEYPAAKTIWEQ